MKVEYLIIKEENQYCKSVDNFLSFLRSNGDLKIGTKEIRFNNLIFQFKIVTDTINNSKKAERYFVLEISRKEATKQKIVTEVEKLAILCKAIREMIIKSEHQFYLITLKDDIAEYYSLKSYPLLHEIENLMRKLIFKFMFRNVGINWLEEATPKEVREKITKKAERNNTQRTVIQDSLYEAYFIQLADFLFKPYFKANIDELTKKVSNALKITDLKLTDLQELVPKSNWDRYFAKFIELDGLKDKWTKLYELRNKVAHNKPINKGDYKEVQNLTTEVREKLLKAIEKVDSIKISDSDKKEVTDSAINDLIIHQYKTALNSYDFFLKDFDRRNNNDYKTYGYLDYISNLVKSGSADLAVFSLNKDKQVENFKNSKSENTEDNESKKKADENLP